MRSLVVLFALVAAPALAADVPPLLKPAALKAQWVSLAGDLHVLATAQAAEIASLEAQLALAVSLTGASPASRTAEYEHITWRYVDSAVSGDFRYLRRVVPATGADWDASAEPLEPEPAPELVLRLIHWEAETDAAQGRGGNHPATEESADSSGGRHVAYWLAGEWLEYSLPPEMPAGVYTLRLRVAAPHAEAAVAITVDGGEVAAVALPQTADWATWQTVSQPIAVPAGARLLRLTGSGPYWVGNLDWVELAPAT